MATHNTVITIVKCKWGPPRETHSEILQAVKNHKQQHYKIHIINKVHILS